MFNINQLKNELENRYKENLELEELEKYIHIWRIEPSVVEDAYEAVYDDNTVHKIYRGIKLQQAGYNEEAIPVILNKKRKDEELMQKQLQDGETRKKLEKMLKDLALSRKKDLNKETNQNENVKEVVKIKAAHIDNGKSLASDEKTVIKNIAEKVKNYDTIVNNSENQTQTKEKTLNKGFTELTDKLAGKISTELIKFFNESSITESILETGKLKRDNELLANQVKELITANTALTDTVNRLEQDTLSFKKLFRNIYIKF